MRQLIITACDVTWITTWALAYILIVYKGFRNKTWGLSIFCIGLNLVFEVLYGFFIPNANALSKVGYIIWALIDLAILMTYILYGKRDLPVPYQRYFPLWILFVFGMSILYQLAFFFTFSQQEATQYSSFLQSLIISISLIWWYINKKNLEAQSVWIAVLILIGNVTVAAEVGGGIWQYNIFVLLMGIGMFVCNILYLFLMLRDKLSQKRNMETENEQKS